MELIQLFKNPSLFFQDLQRYVLVFTGTQYPHAFFMQLLNRIKNIDGVEIKNLDFLAGDISYQAQLATSFLGMQCVYWLGDISSCKQKQKDDFIAYLAEYQGPHKVVVYLGEKVELPSKFQGQVIVIKDKYFFDDAKMIWGAQDLEQAQKTVFFLQQIYKIKNNYTLDELFLLKNYQDLIAADSKEFYDAWLSRLVEPDTSLFTLSQLFFEKKEEAFFKMWFAIKDLYSEMFWISFWSDQLYRAYLYVACMQEDNIAGAKQVSFGLSFTFLKQTYRHYQLSELQQAHQALFTIDFLLKTGGHVYQIDQWYIQFLSRSFK